LQSVPQQPQLDFIDDWHDHPLFHRSVAEKVNLALKQLPAETGSELDVIFTAHSLPETILKDNDPYPHQLHASCEAVARLCGVKKWSLAYQSRGANDQPWLGPDILEVLEELASRKRRRGGNVLVVPIGFVSDHLEVLYDLDIGARDFAKAHGLSLMRTESLNTSPTFISALADLVRRRAAPSG
jgi:ferrochelatase